MSNPYIRRLFLARRLADARRAAGLSQDQVAIALAVSKATVVRIEAAAVKVTKSTLLALLALYGITQESDRAFLLELHRGIGQQGWWVGLNPQDPQYVATEEVASRIRLFGITAVPSLLQTPAYTRALLQSSRRHLAGERLDQQVELRRQRQDRVLHKEPRTTLWVVMGEAALMWRYGTAQTMTEQLRHLIFMSDVDGVTLQVLPLDAQTWVPGSFTLMDLKADDEIWTYAHTEGIAGDIWMDRVDDVQAVSSTFDQVATAALDVGASRGLIYRHLLQLGVSNAPQPGMAQE